MPRFQRWRMGTATLYRSRLVPLNSSFRVLVVTIIGREKMFLRVPKCLPRLAEGEIFGRMGTLFRKRGVNPLPV